MKFLYRPLSPFIVGQKFGENQACVEIGGTKVIACNGHNPPKGYKSVYGSQGHTGIDLAAYHGQEVYCAQQGTIVSIDTNPRTGLDVRIQSLVEGRTFIHIYEHLLGYQGEVGDEVRTGQLIGWADNTGWSSGDHLHFGLKELVKGKWVYIDPLPHFSTIDALTVLRFQHSALWFRELVARLLDNTADRLRQH